MNILSDMASLIDIEQTKKSCAIATWIMEVACGSLKTDITQRKDIDTDKIKKELDICLNMLLLRNVNLMQDDQTILKFAVSPKIEGGENYRKEKNMKSDNLSFDIFQCYFSINYNSFISNYTRSLILNPTVKIKQDHNYILTIEQYLIDKLKDGAKLSAVHTAVMAFAQEVDASRFQNLKVYGSLLIPNINQQSVIMDSESQLVLCENMIFQVNLELLGMKEDGKDYSLANGDTVLVRKNKSALVLTQNKKVYQGFVIEEGSSKTADINQKTLK